MLRSDRLPGRGALTKLTKQLKKGIGLHEFTKCCILKKPQTRYLATTLKNLCESKWRIQNRQIQNQI